MVAASALVIAPLVVGSTATMAAAADAPVLASTFDGGTYAPWVVNGGATLALVADPGGSGQSLKVSGRTHAYDGVALDLTTVLQRDVSYAISFKARLADAAQPAGGVHFTVDDGSYTWVSGDGALTADAWTTVSGSYTLATGATPGKLYLDTSGATFPDVLLDDVTITGPASGGGGTTCTPTAATTLASADFTDSTLDGLWNDGSSTATFEPVDGNPAARITGRAHDYDGLQTATGDLSSLTPGQTVTLSAKVRLAGTTSATTSARLVVKPAYTWVGNSSGVSTAAWTTLTGTYTVPDTGVAPADLQVYLGTDALSDGTATYDYYVDDVSITLPGVDCGGTGGGGTGDTCTYPTSDTLVSTDFESGLDGWAGRDDGHGTATVAVTDGGHGGAHSVLVSNRQGQGQGLGHDVTCVLQPGTGYQFTGWVRFGAGQPTDALWLSIAATKGGSTTYSTLAQFTGLTNNGWTQVSAKFTMPQADSALLYLETSYQNGAAGNTSDLLLDDLSVTKPTAATVQDLTPIKDTVPFAVGAAIDSRETSGAASQLLVKHFDQVTPENFMKPEAWYNADHSFVTENAEADALMTFAQQNHLKVYGHTLAWHSQTPDWFFQHDDGTWLTNSPADQAILSQRLHDHINDVAKYLSDRYGAFGSATNPLYAFDVVNEAVSDGTGDPDGLRQSHWYQVLGEKFIEQAFQDANAAFNGTYAAPGVSHPVTLFLNDYNTEQTGKQDRLYALVQRLLADGVPIDGIGHQFHVNLAMPVDALGAAIERFEGLGLRQAVTELDVPTGTPVTQSNLIDQGYYYKAVFDMLRAHSADIFSATVWGLTDGRSWRVADGAPLVFDDDLQAKPAYYGITDQTLPARQRSAVVFQGDVPLGAGATTSLEWQKLPLHAIDDHSAFQLRWATDHLTAYVHVTDATASATDGLQIDYAGRTLTVPRTGADPAVATVTPTAGGYDAVVTLPLDTPVAAGGTLPFDVRVVDDATTTGWNSPGVLGTLQLVEPLSFVEIPEAATAPTIDGAVDAGWTSSASVTTAKQVSGTGGASATVHTLWKGNTLYVLADVTDPSVDTTASDPWQQDSVELFVDAGNAKAGGYRADDTQIRISADNLLSFGTGDETAQRARVTSATSRTDHGYVVEAAVSLLENGGLGAFEGLDFQVNDGTAGTRTAIRDWADPTGNGYQTTARWGVGRLVAAPAPPAVAPVVTTQPASTTVGLGATATFVAAASGTPVPTVTWQRNVGGVWSPVPGATTTTLTVVGSADVDGAQYRAVFQNAGGSATTNAATLSIKAAKPVVTTQPRSAAGTLGSTVTFTAAASGYPTPTVQWQHKVSGSWRDVAGARSTSLVVTVDLGQQGASYRAVFTNAAGSATTGVATVTLQAAKPTILQQPASVTSSPLRPTSFHVDAVGYPAPHYQWYVRLPGSTTWARAPLGTSDTLYVLTLPWWSGTQVRVVVSSSAGSVTSSAATLTVRP
ncbi:endo-1,4-beta-xylanase [Cellulomonas sp. McL0617]|uniref:endo-1,4-beta-xylanase n=1 Tax=Cellulomonas sp. McL0617 TaxID=3415675 RepID=UPI003CF8D6A9